MATESRFRLWGSREQTHDEKRADIGDKEKVAESNSDAGEQNAWNVPTPSFVNLFNEDALKGAPFSVHRLSEMARSPMRNIRDLRRWARWAYNANGTVSTAVDALTYIYSLDHFVVAKPKRRNADKSVRNEKIAQMNKALSGMRVKEVIRDALFYDMRDGMYVGYFETRNAQAPSKKAFTDYDLDFYTEINDRSEHATVISLPIDYVRIVGRRNSCYEAAFDLRYFEAMTDDQRGRTLKGMPRQIQEGWEKYSKGDFKNGECWILLDWRKTIIHKIKSGSRDPFGVPFVIAALDDIEYAKYFTNTKRNVLDSVNNQIYYETFPEGKEKGTSALTQKQQKEQHENVKSALTTRKNKNGVSFFSLAAGTKMDRLPVDISLLDEDNENAIKENVNKGIGVSAAVLNGSASGTYATAALNLQLVASDVYAWIEALTEEINKCVNLNLIKSADYRVNMCMLPTFFVNRAEFVKQFADLYARGKGSLIAWIAATGVNADDYITLMDYELDEDFENKYPVHKTSFTVTGKDAPEHEDVDDNNGGLESNPSTESTVANNGNASPAPSDH